MKDAFFKKPQRKVNKFTFNAEVVQVFDDMIHRSIPFYAETLEMCAELIFELLPEQTRIYDVGCSTGNLVYLLTQKFKWASFCYIGIDNSSEMLSEAKKRYQANRNISFEKSTLQECHLSNAGAIVMNYVLQFIPPSERIQLMHKVFCSLLPKGFLILSEKIQTQNDILKKLHLNFKRKKGYSDLEISQKREALDQVLIPLSLEENVFNLNQAGFRKVEIFFACYNFVSILAQK